MTPEERAEAIRLKRYKANLAELRALHDGNSQRYTVRLPKFLIEEMKSEKRKDLGFVPAKLVAYLLNFVCYGPHPFANPMDAAEDMARVYQESKGSNDDVRKETYSEVIEKIEELASKKGIKL